MVRRIFHEITEKRFVAQVSKVRNRITHAVRLSPTIYASQTYLKKGKIVKISFPKEDKLNLWAIFIFLRLRW